MTETGSDSDDLTIDALAAEAAIPVSTVRLYQNRGILPPPQKRGRVGYYGAGHRARLRMIAQLQQRGYSLAAIKETVDAWAEGQSLADLLGIGIGTRAPIRLTPAELAERFDGLEIHQADLLRAVELGLVRLDGAEIEIASETFAEIGPAVGRIGVPVSEILDEYEVLQRTVAGIAERFRAVFERHVWRPFEAEGLPESAVADVVGDADRLAALATTVVTAELQAGFAAFVEDYLARAGVERAALD